MSVWRGEPAVALCQSRLLKNSINPHSFAFGGKHFEFELLRKREDFKTQLADLIQNQSARKSTSTNSSEAKRFAVCDEMIRHLMSKNMPPRSLLLNN